MSFYGAAAMIYGFHDFTLDQDRHELRRAGQVVSVEPKTFQVLLYLQVV
jgi:DNA-binding winged helix-turn-helix (wHTH) protein